MNKSIYESWYPDKEYSPKVEKYFQMIEASFKVQLGDGSWDNIKLTPHQREFHSNDISVLREKAKYEIIDKSRNTSFTVSSIIRLATGNYWFRDEIVPLVRINESKVKELIKEAKKIIQRITPIQLPNSDYWPFNPKLVEYSALSITFPDRGVVWQGYPALSPEASENIRGVRTTRVLIDESNFIRFFKEVYTAARDSKRGKILGTNDDEVLHQISIGSTLKGFSKYYYWREGIINKIKNGEINNFNIYSWPIFDPNKFDFEKPLQNYEELIPIVPWHSKETIKNIIKEDYETFLEEYMATVTADENQLYNISKIMDLADSKEILTEDMNEGIYYGGCDPAGEGHHFFSISIWEKDSEGILHQIYLDQEQKTDLTTKEKEIRKMLDTIPFTKFRIDGNGLAYQMAQSLKKDYPNIIEIIRGNVRIKGISKTSIGINEYLHTNQKTLINNKKLRFLDDDLQYKQYAGWNRKYKAEDNKEVGHCDSVIANGLAIMPDNWRVAGREISPKVSNEIKDEILSLDSIHKQVVEENNKPFKDKLKDLRRKKKK